MSERRWWTFQCLEEWDKYSNASKDNIGQQMFGIIG